MVTSPPPTHCSRCHTHGIDMYLCVCVYVCARACYEGVADGDDHVMTNNMYMFTFMNTRDMVLKTSAGRPLAKALSIGVCMCNAQNRGIEPVSININMWVFVCTSVYIYIYLNII